MAPSRKERVGSGTTRSASNLSSVPRPSHLGQAPKGLLKENRRGSISSMVKPETGQANFSEKRMRSCVSFFDLLALSSAVREGGKGLSVIFGDGQAVGELERGLEAVGQTVAEIGPDDDAVDHHIDDHA